jgi:hypothetical protein
MTREESTMKHPKKPELWSNVEISADTDGYLAAQEASRELRAEQERERQVADDLDRFRERFLIEGGRECDVEAAFWQTRTARKRQPGALTRRPKSSLAARSGARFSFLPMPAVKIAPVITQPA